MSICLFNSVWLTRVVPKRRLNQFADVDSENIERMGRHLCAGDAELLEYDMERIMEQLETRCYDGLQEAMKRTEGIGIEYDEDVVCDICRSVCSAACHRIDYGSFISLCPSILTAFSRWTWLSRHQKVSILDFIGANAGGDSWSQHESASRKRICSAVWIL